MTNDNITHRIIERYPDGDGVEDIFDDFTDEKALDVGEIRAERPLSERTVSIEVERWDNTDIDDPTITILGWWQWNDATGKYERDETLID